MSAGSIAKLVKFYGSFEAIMTATSEEIEKVTNRSVAAKIEQLKESEICEIIGEANGEMRSYIDLICFDKDELEKKTKEFSKELGVKIEICEFKR